MTSDGLADWLTLNANRIKSLPVAVGFDAFVDVVQEVVEYRLGPHDYRPLETIGAFSAWSAGAAGRSGLREVITRARTMGGCSVNSGDALISLGFPVAALAGVGEPMDPVFASFKAACRTFIPLGLEPGRSTVYEFRDGKLMLCETAHLSGLSPEMLGQPAMLLRLRQAFQDAQAILLTAWSVYPRMTDCWQILQREVLGHGAHRPRIFIDLADPAGRNSTDILAMLKAMPGFNTAGPVTLSLNGNEAQRLAQVLEIAPADLNQKASVENLALALQNKIGVDEVGIHTIRTATAANAQGIATVSGPFCPRPRRSVGAGDRFNAGWLAGHLLGLENTDRLRLGCAVSGSFVRTTHSPGPDDLIHFLRQWAAGTLDAAGCP